MRTKLLAISAVAALTLSACGDSDADGVNIGDTDALSDVDINNNSEGPPDVLLHGDIEADENTFQVTNHGDGEQVQSDYLVEYQMGTIDLDNGGFVDHTFDELIPPVLWLAQTDTAEGADSFIFDAISQEGVTIGSDVLIYVAPDEQAAAMGQSGTLMMMHLERQYPAYADGELLEQSGDLPEIDHEIGTAPELGDYDGDEEPPTELESEVLIESGTGEEIAEDDYLMVQYRGWRWSDGEIFDGSWPEEGGAPTDLAEFPLTGVIEGWTEGISGHQVGDRILLVIPPEQAYGVSEDTEDAEDAEDDVASEPGDLVDETLIFVVDILMAIDGEVIAEFEQQQMPSLDFSEEEQQELEELAEEMGMSVDELEMFAIQLGATSVEELRTVLEGTGEGEETDNEAPDAEDSDADSDQDNDDDDAEADEED